MSAAAGALLGLVVACGLLLILGGAHASRRPRLADRITVRSARTRAQDRGPLTALRAVVAPGWDWLVHRRDLHASLASRLAQAGRGDAASDPVSRHRLEQVAWAGSGAGMGLVLGLLALAQRPGSSVAVVGILLVLGLVVGVLLHDRMLQRAVRARGKRLSEQLPTVGELLAFAVAAGEAPLAAMDRVARTVTGDLAQEMATLVSDVRGGAPFIAGLRSMGARCPSAEVARFIDGIIVATERGTPMADVLRAQASDARASGRRQLMEAAGRKEILMLIPVVFFVLPIVVVIALFPGIYGLSFTVL